MEKPPQTAVTGLKQARAAGLTTTEFRSEAAEAGGTETDGQFSKSLARAVY
eukprot:COSAG02_NODE_1030_length_15077_cov_36.210119_9_plen_51_part_00